MSSGRKRRIRLVVAMSAALVLAGALAYTSFSSASEAMTPSGLLRDGKSGQSYRLTGKVVPGSIKRDGLETSFRVRDRTGAGEVAIRYGGVIPDTFRAGREVVITVRGHGAEYVGEKDTLITKCPSKFQDDKPPTGKA